MKKLLTILVLSCLLCGCGAQETFETVGDVYAPQELPRAEVVLSLPEDAVLQTMGGSTGSLYFCNGYTLTVQTLAGGDLNRTLLDTTGYEKGKLSVMETVRNGVKRFDCVWLCAGEGGDELCRAAILDDGNYHYVVSVMAKSDEAGKLSDTWQELLGSVTLRTG